jgi:hypothetical protein
MKTYVSWWRHILAGDIVMHLTAVWWFAFLPPTTLNEFETLIMIVSTMAGFGVIAHAFDWFDLPGEQWSYLAAGFIMLLTMIVYEVSLLGSPVPFAIRFPFGLFLLAGTVSAFAAHVIDGGQSRGARGGR